MTLINYYLLSHSKARLGWLMVGLLLSFCNGCIFAATETWDGGGADNNWMTDANWADNTRPLAGDDLVFAGSTRTNPCVNNYTAGTIFNSITFSNTAGVYNITGNSITLTGGITNNDGSDQTIALAITIGSTHAINAANGDIVLSGIISGSGSLVKTGTNDLTLSGVNTYSGSTTITAGRLEYTADSALSGTGAIVLNGGTLYHVHVSALPNSLSVTASSTIESNDGDDITFSSNSISWTAGTLSLTRTGGAFPREVNFSGSGFNYGGGFILDANSRLVFTNTSGSQTFSGVISGTGDTTTSAVQRIGVGGTTILSNTNTYTSPTDVADGTLLVTGTVPSATTVGSGDVLGGSGTISASVTLSAGATIAPGTGGTTISTLSTGAITCNATSTYSVDINGTSADRITSTGTFTCAGTLTVASVASPTLSQSYIIASGTSVTGTFAGLADGERFAQQGRIFQINYSSTQVTLTDVTNARVWDGGGADDNWMTAANWVGDVAPVAGEDLLFTGSVRLTPNNNFTSTNFGSLYFDSTAGNFDLTGNQMSYSGSIVSGGGTQKISLPIVMNTTRTVAVMAGTLELAGVISGAGGVTKTGAASLICTGVNTYAGDTTITAGKLQYSADNVLNGTGGIILNGGTLYYAHTSTISRALTVSGNSTIEASGGQDITFSSNSISWSSGTLSLIAASTTRSVAFSGSGFTYGGDINIDSKSRLRFSNSSGSQLFSGVISGSGTGGISVQRNQAGGSTTLSGANTFTLRADVTGGTLFITGSQSGNAQVASGAFLGGTGTITGTMTLNAGSTIFPGTGGTTIGTLSTGAVTCNATSTYSVDIDGTTADRITSTGAFACNGTLTVASVANPIPGQVYTIASGTSVSDTFSGLANNATFVAHGRTWVINYTGTTVTLTDTPQTRTWDGGGGNDLWSTAANWSGDVAPLVDDYLVFAGTTRLTPSNDYTADTRFGSITFNNTAGAFTLSGNRITLGGSITNSDADAQTISLPIILSATRTIDAASGSIVLSGIISGTGGLTKAGANQLTLSGSSANTYSGLTTVNAGRLHLNKSSGVNAIPGNLTNAGGQITFNSTLLNQIADTCVFTQSGSGSVMNGTGYQANYFALDETFADISITGGLTQTGLTGGSANVTVTGTTSITGGAGATEFITNSATLLSTAGLSLTAMTGSVEGNANVMGLSGNSTVRQTEVRVGASGLTMNNSNINLRLGALSSSDKGSKLVLDGNLTTTGTAASQIRRDTTAGSHGSVHVELASAAGAATRTFTIGGSGADLTISIPVENGAATPGSIIKAGSGTMTLSAVNTYTGTTAVNSGTLLITGSTSTGAVSVASGATLAGTGTIGGATTVAAGGILAPGTGGTTQGVLNTANVNFSGAGTLSLNLVNGTPNNEGINTTGTFDCSNATLTVASIGSPANGTVYTIINASTAVSGTFTGLANNSLFTQSGRQFRITYNATSVTLTDTQLPVLTSRQTIDFDGNGQIDRIRLTFDQALNTNFTGLTVTVGGTPYTTTAFVDSTPNDAVLDVSITESGSPDTGTTPSVRITGNSTLASNTSGGLVAAEGSATDATDAAAPVLISSTWNDVNPLLTTNAGDTVTLVFSESVTRTSTPISAFNLPVSGDSWGSTAAPADGSGTSITLTLAGSFVLTPGGTYSSAATNAGRASGVFISNGSTMVDAVSLPVTTGLAASARDLVSTTNAISIKWSSGSPTAARPWALSTISLGDPRNTVTDGINLGMSNDSDISVELLIKVGNSTSGWTPHTSAGTNQFLVKALNGTPASPTSAGDYNRTLSGTDQSLINPLYTGQSTGLNLYFQAPTSITVGGGTAQTITVTITAQVPP
jgi:fibronectin-binding autotransporter adhesin